jgi:hypothetical protein
MTYQDIQDYADMLCEARIGTADFNEVMSDIRRAKPTPSELAAIRTLADAYALSAQGYDVDWDEIENKVQEILK